MPQHFIIFLHTRGDLLGSHSASLIEHIKLKRKSKKIIQMSKCTTGITVLRKAAKRRTRLIQKLLIRSWLKSR